MEWVVGGVGPQAGKVEDFILGYLGGKALDAIADNYEAIKEENKDKTEDERVMKSINNMRKAGRMK